MGVWTVAGFYVLTGAVIALGLLFFGLSRFDSNAASAPILLKLLWLPGCIALWPLLLRRALGSAPPEDRP